MKRVGFLIGILLLYGCSNVEEGENPRYLEFQNRESTDRAYLQGKEMLTLDEALQIGLDRNLDLKTKEIEKEIARLDKNIAFGNFLPKISLTYSETLLNKKLKAQALDTNLPLQLPMTLETRVVDKSFSVLGINASLPIFVPSTWFLYSARQKGENIAGLTKELTEKMIKLKIISQYYYILALESERSFLEEEVSYSEILKKNSELALKTGSILEWENKGVEALADMKSYALAQNKRDLELAKIDFLNTLNLYPFLNIELVKPVPIQDENISLDTAIYEALKNSDLISIQEQVEGVSKDLSRIAISNFLPKIVLSGGYVSTDVEVLKDNNFFMGTLGGMFSIFNGFQNVNEYIKARETQKVAYIKKEQEILKVIFETASAYNQLIASREEKEIAQKNYEAMKGMLEEKRLAKETGIIDDWEYVKASSEYEKALSLREKSEFKYQISLAVLNMLMEKDIFKGDENNETK